MTPEGLKRFGEWKRQCRRQYIADCAVSPNILPTLAITSEERKRELAERVAKINQIIKKHST